MIPNPIITITTHASRAISFLFIALGAHLHTFALGLVLHSKGLLTTVVTALLNGWSHARSGVEASRDDC